MKFSQPIPINQKGEGGGGLVLNPLSQIAGFIIQNLQTVASQLQYCGSICFI